MHDFGVVALLLRIIPHIALIRDCIGPQSIHLDSGPDLSIRDRRLNLAAIIIILVEVTVSDDKTTVLVFLILLDSLPFLITHKSGVDLRP